MVPISRKKQAAGITFSPTFGRSAAPVTVSPATPKPRSGEGGIDAPEPLISSPQALQTPANEPI